jgi:CHAD domain-containing protein/uncharacterized protein YjbK
MHKHIEREVKFEAPDGASLPELSKAVRAASVRSETVQLCAVYYDTEDRHLQRHGITLRRRTGGDDAGWHLKVPADLARVEHQVASESRSVPRDLADLVKGIRLSQRLTATATLETTRTRHLLEDDAGQLIAEVAEDHVRATPAVDGREPRAWREIEVELGPAADESALTSLRRLLEQHGIELSSHASKYARAVGEPPERERPRRIAGLVDDYLQQQYEAFAAEDLRMRLGENRVHKMRVAVRRTRSTIRVFSALFDDEAAASLETELRWFADVLGKARDLDIVRERLMNAVSEMPSELLLGPVAADLESALASDRASAGRAVTSAFRGRRYGALLRQIDRWRVAAPWNDTADDKASTAQKYARKAGKKARRRLGRAIESGDAEAFHSARKAAKRYRYAVELIEPCAGTSARSTVSRIKLLQDQLGELQDTVTSSCVLLDLGRRLGHDSGRNGFGYGVLYGREQQVADDIRRQVANDTAADRASE